MMCWAAKQELKARQGPSCINQERALHYSFAACIRQPPKNHLRVIGPESYSLQSNTLLHVMTCMVIVVPCISPLLPTHNPVFVA